MYTNDRNSAGTDEIVTN